jgi:hypothetical protein
MKKTFQILASIVLLFSLVRCVTYDAPLLYSKGYEIGVHEALRFDGYYIDTNLLIENKLTRPEGKGVYLTCPLFFYKDGSVKLWPGLRNELYADSLLAAGHDWGRIGIYKVSNDTLFLEYWVGSSSSWLHKFRTNKVLKITDNQLQLVGVLNEVGTFKEYDRDYQTVFRFRPSKIKPNHQPNWIFEREKWNE